MKGKKSSKNKKKNNKVKGMQVGFLDAVNKLIMYYNSMRFYEVVSLYESIFKKSGINEKKLMTREIFCEAYIIAAFSYVQLGNYNYALDILNNLNLESLKKRINDEAYYMIPLCYHQIYMYKKDYEKELEYSEVLIGLRPQLSTNYLRRGFAYNNLKEYDKAEKDFIYALEHGEQDNSQVYINLIILYMDTLKFNEALKYIEKSYFIFKNTEVEFLFLLMKIAVLLKLEKYEEFIDTLEYMYELIPYDIPDYKIVLIRLEGKNYMEAYEIIYSQIIKYTEDPRVEVDI